MLSKNLNVRIRPSTYSKLTRKLKNANIKISDYIRILIQADLMKSEKESK